MRGRSSFETATHRVRRTERRPERSRLRLTKRDPWLLEDVAKMRFATTGQLARLHFAGSRSAATKRLRRLFDAGLLRAWVLRLDGENVYSLASRGARLMSDRSPAVCHAPRGLDGNLAHLLALGSVRVALAVTMGDCAELVAWRSYWDLEPEQKGSVIPDALFELRSKHGHRTFALELDRTVPAPKAFLRRILNYDAMNGRGYGVAAFTLLIVGSQSAWLERYRQQLAEHPIRIPVWLATFDDVQANGANASWRSLRGEQHPSLRTFLTVRTGRVEERPHVSNG